MTWTPFSPARFLVMIPPWGLATVLVAIASLLPAGLNGLEDALMVTAICSLLVGFVAFLWPRPFLPRWAKDADARIEAGLPPTMPEPVELAAGRRMTRRQWIAGHLVLLAAIVANLVFRVGPPSIAGPLLMGWAFWAAAQARAASGR